MKSPFISVNWQQIYSAPGQLYIETLDCSISTHNKDACIRIKYNLFEPMFSFLYYKNWFLKVYILVYAWTFSSSEWLCSFLQTTFSITSAILYKFLHKLHGLDIEFGRPAGGGIWNSQLAIRTCFILFRLFQQFSGEKFWKKKNFFGRAGQVGQIRTSKQLFWPYLVRRAHIGL